MPGPTKNIVCRRLKSRREEEEEGRQSDRIETGRRRKSEPVGKSSILLVCLDWAGSEGQVLGISWNWRKATRDWGSSEWAKRPSNG